MNEPAAEPVMARPVTGTVVVSAQARPQLTEAHLRSPRKRVVLPIVLFIATCLSTFWVGTTGWVPVLQPVSELGLTVTIRWTLVAYWQQGFAYMLAVLAILLTHEMGHFLTTVFYRIPASLPFFIPYPFSPIGTMGAVIGMAGYKANRKQIFDIGIAGPLAGLLVAVPVLYFGVRQLDMSIAPRGGIAFDCPLMMRWLFVWLRPEAARVTQLYASQMNPMLMAAWVGLLITGLNMCPVSQLDGGHVIYSLFPRHGRYIARGFLIFAICYVVYMEAYVWSLMIILVTLMGVDHPPTADDRVPLGWFRTALGLASLLIPFLCFPPRLIS